MMEIKFRGKSVESGEWIYGDLIKGEHYYISTKDDFHYAVVSIDGHMSTFVNIVIPESVGEYTGLHDKNGKDIYEGDVACVPYIDCIFGDLVGKDIDYDFKFVVNFKDASFVLSNKDRGNIYINEFGINIEIIGNIHDNPELIHS